MDSPSEIRFSVRYRLGEYLVFVTEHSFETEEALSATRGATRLLAQLFQRTVASVAFLHKMSRLGECDFVITAAGLSRRTKLGTSSVPWSSVKAVHTCTPGYLVELQQGAVPIPFRVLDQQQRELFCTFASDRLVA
ncbi:MAG TPA: YcxB family protein [Candidatus Luteimonas excrementigallinarum]|nr:YcxB family protein [Candidatus Luteimonas excrementigallinarum]